MQFLGAHKKQGWMREGGSMITVTALCPVAFDPVPALEQPAEAGVVGVLLVEPADGRRFGLVQTDLLEALTFLGAGRQVIDERAVCRRTTSRAGSGTTSRVGLRPRDHGMGWPPGAGATRSLRR